MAYTAAPLRRPPAQPPSPYGANNPPLVSPPAAFDPSARPSPGGHSPNFLASVAANNAGAKARQDAFAAGATPAESVTTPTGPSMGMARIGDQVRYYPQTADSPATLQARKDARVSGQDAGAAARASSLAGSQQQFDAQHPPLVDPKALVAKSLAGKYDKEGDAAATRASNDTALTQTRSELLKQQRDRLAALTPGEQQKLQQQVQTLVAQGKLADAHALLAGEQTQTEQAMRPGKVAGQAVHNQATTDANARANQRLPFENYRDAATGYKSGVDKMGDPIPGAPQPPTINPPAGAVAPAAAAPTGPPTVAPPAPYVPPAPVQPIPVPPAPVPAAPAPAAPAPAQPAAQTIHAPRLNRAVTMDELQATAGKHGISVDDVKRQLGIQ